MPRIKQNKEKYETEDFRKEVRIQQGERDLMSVTALADEVASIAAALQTSVSKLSQQQVDPMCHNCKFWNQFYVKRPDGKIIPWFYGYCFRPGCCGPREEWLSCKKYQQRK